MVKEKICCDSCIKKDVCKLKEQYCKDYQEMINAIIFPDDFIGKLECKHFCSNNEGAIYERKNFDRK